MSSYKALYRKYRPQTFNEVCDQEYITRTLINAIKLGRISHAYLFNGPRGVGKTTIARIFAKAINCENVKDGEPCDECDICKSIANGSNPDVIEIDAASRTKVDQMRDTLEKVNYLPTMSKYKVYIIDEVHMLSTSSFNALLKTLEEPPKHVVFILCTTEVEKVIPTIRSRCQRFDFHLMSKEAIENRLEYVTLQEGLKIEKEALSLIAEAAEGGMRDSLSLLDQISAFSINDTVSVDDVLEVSGKLSTEVLINLALNINNNDSSSAINDLDSLLNIGKEIEKITQSLITFYKDILVIKNTSRETLKVGYEKEEFKSLTKSLTNQKLYKYIDILTNAMMDYRYSTNKRLYLELALIKMCDKQEFSLKEAIIPQIKEEKVNTNSLNQNYSAQTFITPKEEIKSESVTKPIIENVSTPIEPKESFVEFIEPVSVVEKNKEEEKTHEEPQASIEEVKNDNPIEPNKPQYDIHFIEKILNNADKPFKEELIQSLDGARRKVKGTSLNKYSLLLEGGNIVASSRNSFVITFTEVGHCNLIMKEDNANGVKEILKNELHLNLDFIAIPFDLWKQLSDEYVRIYKENQKNQKNKEYIYLTHIDYPGLRINVKNDKKEDDDKFKDIEDLFGDILTIK